MDREILFRGKRTDNGEWVEGFYFCMVHDDGRHVHHFIIPLGTDLNLGTPIEKVQVEVDPETVCQYTGLTDRNGRKIWEHDIIRCEGKLFKIDWVPTCAFFAAHPLKESRTSPCLNVGTMKISEVVGNVFDNPELLERQEGSKE